MKTFPRDDGRPLVMFTNAEMMELRLLARRRNEPKELAGIHSDRVDQNRTNAQIHLLGIKGEAAAAHLLGLELDRTASLKGDGNVKDLTAKDGRSIQVKTTWHVGGRLLFQQREDFKADLAILFVSDEDSPAARIIGWTDQMGFNHFSKKMNFGYGMNHVMEQADLYPISRFGTFHDPQPLQWHEIGAG